MPTQETQWSSEEIWNDRDKDGDGVRSENRELCYLAARLVCFSRRKGILGRSGGLGSCCVLCLGTAMSDQSASRCLTDLFCIPALEPPCCGSAHHIHTAVTIFGAPCNLFSPYCFPPFFISFLPLLSPTLVAIVFLLLSLSLHLPHAASLFLHCCLDLGPVFFKSPRPPAHHLSLKLKHLNMCF